MNKKLVLSGLIVVAFILLLVSVMFFITSVRNSRMIDPAQMELLSKEQIIQDIYVRHTTTTPFYYFIPLFGFFGIVVGALVYFIVSGDVERKTVALHHNTTIIMKLLNPEERKVIQKIVENHGKVQQIEITYMQGYTKVKAHRIIDSLVQKGILTKETLGKMRLIRMNPELYAILKDSKDSSKEM